MTQMLYQEMLESLEEAIMVIKGGKIEFQNQLMTSMIRRVKEAPVGSIKKDFTSGEQLKLKFMQIYHKNLDKSDTEP